MRIGSSTTQCVRQGVCQNSGQQGEAKDRRIDIRSGGRAQEGSELHRSDIYSEATQ